MYIFVMDLIKFFKLNIMAQEKKFVASPEAKAKAKQLRLFALLAWAVAIAGEVFAICKLISNEMLTWLIVAIVGILILSIVGSILWKKSNKLDPASEKDKVRFFVQNQLGALIAAVAFLPLILLIFLNKDMDGKSKGIAGGIAVVALLVAGITGIDFNPASIEKYTEQINAQTDVIKSLNNGVDQVYWTPSGNKYHLFEDCQHIRNSEISGGTVEEAWKARNKDGVAESEFCITCKNRAERNLKNEASNNIIDDVVEAVDDLINTED